MCSKVRNRDSQSLCVCVWWLLCLSLSSPPGPLPAVSHLRPRDPHYSCFCCSLGCGRTLTFQIKPWCVPEEFSLWSSLTERPVLGNDHVQVWVEQTDFRPSFLHFRSSSLASETPSGRSLLWSPFCLLASARLVSAPLLHPCELQLLLRSQ